MMTQIAIGLIGVGLMGHGIALNLLRNGYAVTALEHAGNQPLDDLRALGLATAATPAQVAQAAQVLIVCVTGSPQVQAVLQGADGALAALPAGAVVIDCSTSLPQVTEQLAQAVTEAGGYFLDAPMTRTPTEAAQGRLNLLVGGGEQTLQACLPVLRCFAENIRHVGPVGAGHRMKLVHNYVSLGMVALLAEAAAAALDAGLEAQVLVDVLAQGGGAGMALQRLQPFLLQGDDQGLRFAMGNALKDLDYYTQMTQGAGAAQGVAQAVRDCLAQGVQQLGAQTPLPQLIRALRQGD